ncbi:MAG: DUF5723 family protein [bacterium]|nr:DUF5723 family protein [bacterium]
MKKSLFACLVLLLVNVSAQDYQGFVTSNYAGVTGAIVNPANIVDSRMKFDMTLFGNNTNFSSNYIGVKASSLPKPADLLSFGKATFPSSWSNTDKNSPDYFKNNLVRYQSDHDKGMYVSTRLVLPSFMVNLNSKNALALSIGARNYVNIEGLSPALADAAYNEFSDPSIFLKKIKNPHFGMQQMAWGEYGLTYAHVFKDDGEHFFKAGITPKLLQGLTASYFSIDNLEFAIDTTNIYSFVSSQVHYSYSDNVDISANGGPTINFKPSYGFGLDIGGVYEWRPKFQDHKYDMDGKKDLWRKNENKYELKASLAVVDIGGIRYNKGIYSNDFDVKITAWNLGTLDFNGIKGFDSTMNSKFPSSKTDNSFKMSLPTAINAQVDYHLGKIFYVNLMGHIANLRGYKTLNVHDYTTISLAPRVEWSWAEASLPVSYNTFNAQAGQNIKVGAMLRLGPFIFGTNDLSTYVNAKDIYHANFYFMVKVPIPYTKVRDRDKDGISDKKDMCKDVPGTWEFKGCPDRDGDHVKDVNDKCPDQPGLKEFDGCPDRDLDSIPDKDDACPDEKGVKKFNGCPDSDGDDIMDKEDDCPFDAGKAEFKGCPDTDADGTPDREDPCPDEFGPLEYKGCPDHDGDSIVDREDPCPDQYGPRENKGCPWPDTDKDGVLDKEDDCPLVAGVIELKGCPRPVVPYNPVAQVVPMKAAEKKIIEKAFASLEFATAKDLIKPKSFPGLNQLANLMIQHKEDWKLKLAGHTDNEGIAEKNMVLSEKRAKAVKNYLIKKGVKEDQILTEWYGQTVPIGDNKTPAGRQKNRRVEMKILLKE